MSHRWRPRHWGGFGFIHTKEHLMFVFFSNRLGCLGSILVSVVLTLILLLVFGVL